ncbi:exodeoxyribonuclease V subunit beta [Vespertiliibacter pulmonis]|uniref:RecBCD enzyme subunit RecB n=1 Tax=Vespertiliibacter pulmonis TaxID=1443036 RepID=A0A3N4W6I9_9PAST|nr:exodeoxyribonuclease V subunit beta [Vespertiliibacter pulmonis]QLB20516.1 exodeoxyribonuclease V subunit beta [Vespertiliibacter pulmonis]RPE80824.1 DNA helicase/exodeoxyribonuclease V beta subunit [Vespertiliibacter pulmonis]
MNILNPISIPLNQASLIEASAGTGKTYTIANLYLRLILGIACEPMMVEQILVVTFTKAATQELRDRIRLKLKETAKIFSDPNSEKSQLAFAKDPFMQELYQLVATNLSEALLRLSIAEREMDLASIFTIDSFCQKMLFQYAFDSGVRFDIDLQADERDLLIRLSEETWRELFYPTSLLEAQLVTDILNSPEKVLEKLSAYLSEELPPLNPSQQQWLAEDYIQQAVRFEQFLATARHYWKENETQVIEIIQQVFDRQRAEEIKILNGTSYKETSFQQKWLPEINQWVESKALSFPEKTLSYFSQSMLEAKAIKGAEIVRSSHFERWDQFIDEYQQFKNFYSQIEAKLLYRYLQHLRHKLAEYKNSHIEKNFNDMLNYFHQALTGENGDELAKKVRQQFQFAMVDETQDTNLIQYQIFQRIFIDNAESHGFIMIGDPKQSIYKFRGADIFAYLTASQRVAETFTLSKNWRSLPNVVEGINRLFTLPKDQPPFLYDDIHFYPVESNETETNLLNEQQAINLYLLQQDYKAEQAAEHCADQIQQSLSRAMQGELFIQEKDGNGEIQQRVLQPKDIAILVRSHSEAEQIKRSLSARNLQSVFLSERKSVFESEEAKDLALILTACLTPFSQKNVLSALGTALWGLTARDIYQLKNSENIWENYVEQFIGYQQIWQTQGVLPMLHQLFIEQQIVARLNGGRNADRRLTNILHLAELLQEKMDSVENESALLRWFTQQIKKPSNNNDGQILRLESEDALIKIITIHKSKGLEYPVVWLPFVAKSAKRTDSKAMTIYRDEQNNLCWDFNSDDKKIKQGIEEAERAEDLRLLYVALTRAKYQLHLVLPTLWSDKWNALLYLLSDGDIVKNGSTTDYFKRKGITYKSTPLADQAEQTAFVMPSGEEQEITAKEFTGTIREIGQITSFTALQAQNERLRNPLNTALGDTAQDYDSGVLFENFAELTEQENGHFSPYNFPHSTRVGNILHRFFEVLDFQQPLETKAIQQLCEQFSLNDEWIEPVQQWFEQVLQTPFGDNSLFCLADIPLNKRLNEWQFYLRLKNPKALVKINQLLRKHSRLAKRLPDLQFFQFEGYVRGFVDCIVEINQQYYVLDYKSNFLGYLTQDYSIEKIEKTMAQYRYDLQYLLYTLAVHRYLRYRLGEHYDYQRDFGGVAYLFLRGMNGAENSGVYFDKPSLELIEELDQLFG